MKVEIKTKSVSDTEKLAAIIGKNLKGGECIEFRSDLGGGKTTFVRGLATGAGSKDNVSSPTFTISQRYSCKSFYIYHFDFYRLQDPGLVAEELSEIVNSDKNTTIVEWAESVHGVLPEIRLVISINKDRDDENTRTFSFDCPGDLKYLMEGVK